MKKMCVKGDAHLFCYDSIFCFRIDIAKIKSAINYRFLNRKCESNIAKNFN